MKQLLLVMALLFSQINYAKLPVESYAQLPDISKVNLSPSGNAVAFLKNYDGNLVLTVLDLTTNKSRMLLKADNKTVTLSWYNWANDKVLLIGANYTNRHRTVKYSTSRLFKFDLNDPDNDLERLNTPKRHDKDAQFQASIISLLPEKPNKVLVQTAFDVDNKPTVYELDINKNRRKRIARANSKVQYWLADRQGNIRLGYGIDELHASYYLYDDDSNKLTELYTFQARGPEAIRILGFDKDPNIVYLTALHNGKQALFKADITQKPMLPELIFSDPDYDFDGRIHYSAKDGRAIGFSHSNLANSRVYWDEDHQLLQRSLKAALPEYDLVVIDMSRDGQKYIAYGDSNADSGTYLLGDRENKSLVGFGRLYPDIIGEKLLGKTKLNFQARDGLEIEAFLTLPSDFNAASPAIILPHGGPHARDYSGFDYWSELFASRGYVVLQPNFRGSFGYGFDFLREGERGWGGKMQDDLQDAASYLIKNDYALADKICIAGGSYGGYAALMAVVKHPETFQCAASFAGVTDLEDIVQRARYFTNKELIRDQFGEDYDKLEQQSPVNFAKKITRPVLLVHGDDDKIVDVSHSRKMADELEDHDKPVTYIELEDGNHHLSYQGHRIETMEAFLAFFEKHLM